MDCIKTIFSLYLVFAALLVISSVASDVEKTIHLRGDGKVDDVDEDIKFYSKENIAIISNKNGEFNLQDYNKGLAISKDLQSGICYVTLNNVTAKDGRDLEAYLKSGGTTFINMKNSDMELVPSTSFMPPYIGSLPKLANDYCLNGYRWLVKSPKSPDAVKQKRSLSRVKRGCGCRRACIRGCILWVCGKLCGEVC